MKINVDKKSVLCVAIYLSIFFLAIFLGAKFWPNGVNVENKQPVEIKQSTGEIQSRAEYYNAIEDDAQVQEYIDAYIKSLENRIQELETGISPNSLPKLTIPSN
jgi:hypothetical protein